MQLISTIDTTISLVSIIAVLIIALSLMLKKFNQTYIVGYILVGVLLGQSGFNVIENAASVHLLGELGIILLLFFIGMEINLVDFLKEWKIAIIGTFTQVFVSVLLVFIIGHFFDWMVARAIVIGFVIALSSSAVVIKLLEDKNLINTPMGKHVLSILLTQDVIFVPMLIIISLFGGRSQSTSDILMMIFGAIIIVFVLLYAYIKRTITFPFAKRVARDHELQVFMAVFLCFAGALFTSVFGLSAALGAFVGGILINAARETHWIHDTLQPFRILFVSFFFISIGLQIDLTFIYENVWAICLTIIVVYLTNQCINSLILKAFSGNWKTSLLGGALLAQIGELSFLISSMALSLNIINDFGYKFTISIISLTLVISPFWISLIEWIINFKRSEYKKLPGKHHI